MNVVNVAAKVSLLTFACPKMSVTMVLRKRCCLLM